MRKNDKQNNNNTEVFIIFNHQYKHKIINIFKYIYIYKLIYF